MELAPSSKGLECLQFFMSQYRSHSEAEQHGFLTGSEEFVYVDTESLNDFVAIRQPKTEKDTFDATLSSKIADWLIFFRKCQDNFQTWRRAMVS
jgi:hypothetical protein